MKGQTITGYVGIGGDESTIIVGYLPHKTDPRVTFEEGDMIPLTALTVAEARMFAHLLLVAVSEVEQEGAQS